MGVDEKETNDKHRCNGKGWEQNTIGRARRMGESEMGRASARRGEEEKERTCYYCESVFIRNILSE